MLTRFRFQRVFLLASVFLIGLSMPLAGLPASAEDQQQMDLFDFNGDERDQREVQGGYLEHNSGYTNELVTGPERDREDRPSDDDAVDFQRIFPPDERVRITPTTQFAASAVALIEKRIGGTLISTCSGTFIGPSVVLTAAHCLYTHSDGWGTSIAVIPGKDGWAEPYGYQYADYSWVPAEWGNYENPEWDWGILRMPNSNLGNTVGWFQMGALSTQSLMAPNFNASLAGYPADKPYGTMWLSAVPSFLDVNHAFLANRIDSLPGQSGAAVWRANDGVIVGIQVLSGENANLASRVNGELLNYLDDACAQLNCWFDSFVEAPPPTTPDPLPPVSGGPEFAIGESAIQAGQAFSATQGRTDQPILSGQVNRTWMWGPEPTSALIEEPYQDAPGGTRVVQYFDKSRMEDNAYRSGPPWHVTNGLLVLELVTGRMQVSDTSVQQRTPANVQVAGDNHPSSPTYAMLDPLRSWDPIQPGVTITQRLHADGSVTDESSLGQHGVTAGYYVSDTDHSVASVFWNFMNSSGIVYEGGNYRNANIFENPFFASGFPVTEAYWVNVPVGGQWQDVLLQCFERRCLTYTPGNPSGWQVEAGNVGQHYYRWRYGDAPASP